ncbi:MAG: GFA family protein [Gammaproteobacteria bacterium]|nr:GFA family protein [Gammaproteobacteria bacterium]
MHQGGCQCRAVRYQFNGEPLTCYTCHCTDCQTSTGSAFTLSMIVNSSDIEIIKGNCAINTFEHNGTEVQRNHCETCGSALWFMATEMPDYTALKPGTFDDTAWFKPVAHLWLRSAQPWVLLDETTKKYQKQPKMSALMTLWTEKNHA